MHSNPLYRFAATPQGITCNGKPLTLEMFKALPPGAQHAVLRAAELLLDIMPEEWNDRTPHDIRNVPRIAKAQTILTLESPVYLDKRNFNSGQPRVPAGNGRESGRWTDESDDSGESEDGGSIQLAGNTADAAVCRAKCSDLALPTKDFGISFRRCYNQCMGYNSYPEWSSFFP